MKYIKIFLAVFLAIVGASWYVSYSSSHILIGFSASKDPLTSKTDGFDAQSIWTPFHHATNVHLYMVTTYLVKDGDKGWNVQPYDENSLQTGTDFMGFFDSVDATHAVRFEIVCSQEALQTADQVENITWNNLMPNHYGFVPSADFIPGPQVLQCK